jgi:hypothetical protein
VWRPFLKDHPQIVANNLRFFPKPPIPDPLHHNAVTRQEGIAFCVVFLMLWMAMLKAVRFHNESHFGTVKVERVFSEGMLPTEFVTGESLIAEHSPERFLRPGGFLPEKSSAGDLFLGWCRDTPHPPPLPKGRGTSPLDARHCIGCRDHCEFICQQL